MVADPRQSLTRSARTGALALTLAAWCAAQPAIAQPADLQPVPPPATPSQPPAAPDPSDSKSAPSSPRDRAAEYQARRAAEAEKLARERRVKQLTQELRLIRHRYLGKNPDLAVRDEGLARLRAITDPLATEPIVNVLKDEGPDVQQAVIDRFTNDPAPQAEAALTYLALFPRDDNYRLLAKNAMYTRWRDTGTLTEASQRLLASGLRASSGEFPNRVADIARDLQLFEAIPALITAQVVPPPSARADGYLAWIFVGNQRAYVADVTPVVGAGAVAFDPVVGVLNTGAFLGIRDASVTIYRDIVHVALVELTREATGRDFSGLGYNQTAWKNIYPVEIQPRLAEAIRKRDAELAAQRATRAAEARRALDAALGKPALVPPVSEVPAAPPPAADPLPPVTPRAK